MACLTAVVNHLCVYAFLLTPTVSHGPTQRKEWNESPPHGVQSPCKRPGSTSKTSHVVFQLPPEAGIAIFTVFANPISWGKNASQIAEETRTGAIPCKSDK